MDLSLVKLDEVCKQFSQELTAGGIHTPPETRILLFCLAKSIKAETILETGYDAGYTTLALAQTGAHVIGIDNLTEYPETEGHARDLLFEYDNVELLNCDSMKFLTETPDNYFDMVFIDDFHGQQHVKNEAEQVIRILKPGGIAAFHDVLFADLWGPLAEIFQDWQKITFPAISPVRQEDFGLGVFIKPKTTDTNEEIITLQLDQLQDLSGSPIPGLNGYVRLSKVGEDVTPIDLVVTADK